MAHSENPPFEVVHLTVGRLTEILLVDFCYHTQSSKA